MLEKALSLAKASLPEGLRPLAARAWVLSRPLLRIVFFGQRRHCGLCGSSSRFFLAHGPGARRRPDLVCPVCQSHPRHRLAWLYLQRRTNLFDGRPKRVLHFAPEMELAKRFRAIPGVDYLSADLKARHAMTKMDITAMPCADSSFDAVFCSHVLEHVVQDRKAIAEIHRVLKPQGWALVQVPIGGESTSEDPAVQDPGERERLYWQSDHVRLYGLDLRERLAEAGFEVDVCFGRELVPASECERLGIDPAEPVFHARKPRASART